MQYILLLLAAGTGFYLWNLSKTGDLIKTYFKGFDFQFSASPLSLKIYFKVDLINPTNTTINLTYAQFDLYINNTYAGKTENSQTIPIITGTTTIKFLLQTDLISLASVIKTALTDKSLVLKISGSVIANGFQHPVEYSETLHF